MWREVINPYYVVVSEVMLQQTQTGRVEKKFPLFIELFPTFEALAQAPFVNVLECWVGLGYNRRARALHEISNRVCKDFGGQLPSEIEVLETFKGLGKATASSIVAFAFNKPTVFIETNIRTVYLHTFFPGEEGISDSELLPYIEATVDKKNPREWYYALMDYGVMLKKQYKNPSRNSRHHVVQSKFEGSRRQVRGAVLKYLVKSGEVQKQKLLKELLFDQSTVESVLLDLQKEGLIRGLDTTISIF